VFSAKPNGLPGVAILAALSYELTSVYPCWKPNNSEMKK